MQWLCKQSLHRNDAHLCTILYALFNNNDINLVEPWEITIYTFIAFIIIMHRHHVYSNGDGQCNWLHNDCFLIARVHMLMVMVLPILTVSLVYFSL